MKNFLFQLKKGKKKKDRDPTISAVPNIHTRFYIQICEYPSTRILAAALPQGHNLNKLGRGSQGDAINQISRL